MKLTKEEIDLISKDIISKKQAELQEAYTKYINSAPIKAKIKAFEKEFKGAIDLIKSGKIKSFSVEKRENTILIENPKSFIYLTDARDKFELTWGGKQKIHNLVKLEALKTKFTEGTSYDDFISSIMAKIK
jgi:hypothetical protein